MEYFINEEDLGSLDRMARSSFVISSIYEKLCCLDFKGLANSDIYNLNIRNLKLAIDLENQKYKTKEVDLYKTQAFMSLILNNIDEDIKTNEEAVNSMDFDKKEARRVLNKLCSHLNDQITDTVFLKDDVADLTKRLVDNGVSIEDSIKKASLFYSSMEAELLMNFLYFLNIRIKDENNMIIKNNLIKVKYFMAYIFDNVENKLIANNFQINQIVNYSDAAKNEINVEPSSFDFIKSVYNAEIIVDNINTIINVDDVDATNKYPYLLICESFINSALLNINDNLIAEINTNYQDIIKSEDYTLDHPYSKISEFIINNCFKNVNHNKVKVKKLSL